MVICEECKKNPATVHVAQMVNGQKTELHLCQECASKKGALMFDINNKFSIPNLLGSFLGSSFSVAGMQQPSLEVNTCTNCGASFNDIRQTGRLGCPECYTAFDVELEPTLRRIHGNSRHMGKIPARGGQEVLYKQEIEKLKNKLQKAVIEEDYEKAAEIRDQIKQLEKQQD